MPLALIIILTIVVTLTCKTTGFHYDNLKTDLTYGWKTEDGQKIMLKDLPTGDVTITHELNGIDIDRKRLCLQTSNTELTAVFDGVTIYEYAPKQAAILGKSYGMYIHMIPIPVGAKSVTLYLHPIYDDLEPVVKEMAVEDAGMFMGDIYHKGLPNFALCMLISLFGVLMLIMGFTDFTSNKNNSLNFFSLGAFSILIGVWSANDTMILQVFTQHPEIARFINYISLIFLSYLPVSFLASATNHRKTKLLPLIFSLNLINFIVTITLSVLRIKDIREMLLFSHINVAIAMCMVIYLMVRAVKKHTANSAFLRSVIIGMSFAVFGVFIDMVRFRINPNSKYGSSLFTRVGVLIYIVLMGVYLVGERTQIAVEQGQAELMKKLAYTDGLTELGNRAAFHERENRIRRDRTDCVIIQLDINFLKKVNDVYGHAEGDRHIIAASKIINSSFTEIGDSFRTGGDEFIVITHESSIHEVDRALAKLETAVQEYNEKEKPPVPLQIAYGYAHCSMQNDMLKEAEQLADQRMYKKKKEMKVVT